MNKSTQIAAASVATLGMALAAAPAANAAGVAAGTIISNTAQASYASGSGTKTVDSNTVDIKVDELLNVAVSGQSATMQTSDTAVFTFKVTNTGNGSEAFNLSANPAVAGNDYDVIVQQIVIDDGDGVYEPGVDTVLPAGTPTALIPQDGSVVVFVIAKLPADAADGETTKLELQATAVTGSGPAGTVFTGAGDGGGDAVTGSSTAQQEAQQSILASLATLALVKSGTVSDPYGGNQPVPGATITYQIVATATGSGKLDSASVSDVIPTGTTYVPGSVKLDAVGKTDAADADEVVASNAAGIDVDLGAMNGGTNRTVTFQVKIN